MKSNRITIAKKCINDRSEIDKINNKIHKHQKKEKVFENGLTSSSRVKVTIKNLPESLFDKNFVLNISVPEEETTKDIFLLPENVNKKLRMYYIFDLILSNVIKPNSCVRVTLSKMGSKSEIKNENLKLNDISDKLHCSCFNIDGSIQLEIDITYTPSKVNYYNKLLNALECTKEENDENVAILDCMLKSLEGKHNKLK